MFKTTIMAIQIRRVEIEWINIREIVNDSMMKKGEAILI